MIVVALSMAAVIGGIILVLWLAGRPHGPWPKRKDGGDFM